MFQAALEKSTLAGAWSWTFFANGFRILTQGLVFFCVLSRLGPEPYGAMMAIVSVACVLATFSGLGLGPLLVQTVARKPELLRSAWMKASHSTLLTGSVLTLIGMGACGFFFPGYLDLFSLFLVLFSEIVLNRIVDNSASVFQAKQFLGLAAEVTLTSAALRSIAALIFVSPFVSATATNWVWLSSVAVLLSAAWGYFRVTRTFRAMPVLPLGSHQMQVRESIHFALETLGENLSAEMQRMALATFGGAYVTGIYTAAYRAIEIACVPVRSLVYSVGARFFIEGASSVKKCARMSVLLLPPALVSSLFVCVGLYLFAPLVVQTLAPKFVNSIPLLQSLCLLPPLRTLSLLFGQALTGAGYQYRRVQLQLVLNALGLALCALLIPTLLTQGAVLAALITEAATAVVFVGAVLIYRTRTADSGDNRHRLLLILEATAGGTRKALVDLIDGLLEKYSRSYEIHVIYAAERADTVFFEGLQRFRARGVATLQLPMKRNISLFNDIYCLAKIYLYVLNNSIDLVDGQSAKGGMLGRMAGTLAIGVKRIYTPHSSPFRLSFVYRWMERLAGHLITDAIIARSPSEREELLQAAIGKPNKIYIAHNGVRAPKRVAVRRSRKRRAA